MKNKLWLLQIPFVLFFAACFFVTELGARGSLENGFLQDKVLPELRVVSGLFTNIKFRIRGPVAPKNKIVIVDIDGDSLTKYGRWPWHRNITAKLIESSFLAGAKVVGLDLTFSESDQRIPEELREILKSKNLGRLAQFFETDDSLAQTIKNHSDNLVLGWMTEGFCQPKLLSIEECPVTVPEAISSIPDNFAKFSFTNFQTTSPFDSQKTAMPSAPMVTANINLFGDLAKHSGSINAINDPDNYIRREPLITMVNGKPHPALALEMARIGLEDFLSLTLNEDSRVGDFRFKKSGKIINANSLGVMEINFRGPGHTFNYISASELLGDPSNLGSRRLASDESLKDAYVLIGISALGVYDMRAFPFDSNVAGVEGHATILDNILANDAISTPAIGSRGFIVMLLLMSLGALLFAYSAQELESIQGLILFLAILLSFCVIDTQFLFKNNYNWDTGFFLIELCCIFFSIIGAKYILEERNKKFIKNAFAKYVAPSIVESILKDPSKLSLGGERRDLTILFSDIRGFTTFSEQMDAKALSAFLNDYLGIMTKIVFAHDGTLDKYIGDAVMAFWGAPLDQEKHAYNASMAAIEMMQALATNRDRFKSQYNVEVNIGIGLNTGVVSVGNMGSENNFEYTVIGDHVNLASRLESLTKYYGVGIITTKSTIDHISAVSILPPRYRTLDFVKVKGKRKAVELIQLLDKQFSEEGLALFEEALSHYKSQNWDKSIECLEKALKIFQEDGPCNILLARCEYFKKTPPPSDWDGSWEMQNK